MKIELAKIIAILDRVVDYFIPPSMSADRDARNRAHVFLVSHILGPFIGNVVPIALYILDPDPGYQTTVLAISITSFWIFPFLLKAGASYNPLALVSIQNLIFCILWSCYFYGGVTSPTLPWVLVIPLLAFFYLGSSKSLCVIVMIMFVANLAVFSSFYLFGYSVKTNLPVAAMQGLGLVSTVAASLYVAMMALYYAKIQASQAEIESEMRQHMATASALRLATEEAERAGAAKAEFLAKMSHELRTPLNAVIGYSQELLEDAELGSEHTDDLSRIHSAGQHLLKLVNEVLDLSKIEAGKMELDLEDTDLAALLEEAIQAAAPAVRTNGNEIICKLNPNLGTALCDPGKFRNMIGQLLDNAAKFTQQGRVELVAERQLDQEGDKLVVKIVDTGIGIASDKIADLFENFTVGDDSSSSKYGGTGLGLALSQKLCNLMGGEILVDSELGKGSCFTICMPLRDGRRKADAFVCATLVPELTYQLFQPPAGKSECKILLVEDNEINRDMLTRRLQRHGFSVRCAHDGAAGVAMAATEKPDLILMDVALGEMDGWEATQLIKANPATAAIPIIALTAHALATDREKSVEVGCSDFDTKPVDMQRLLGKIRTCLSLTEIENAMPRHAVIH
jgi:signal transduction histidine kinase/ActR/RegA family two-component response regulator